MRRDTIAAIMSIFLLISVAPVSGAYTSLAITGEIVPSTISPGESGNLVLTITNSGTDYARNCKLTISPHSYITFDKKNFELETIGPSSSKQVSVPLTIDSDMTKSATSVFITLTYSEGASSTTSTYSSSVSLSISQRSLVQIEDLEWEPELIQPGNTINATVNLKNVGSGNVNDMTVQFGDSTMPFVAANGDLEDYVGSIPSKSTKTASFSLLINKEAETEAYSVPLTLNYYDESGTSHSETKHVGMKISGIPDFVVTLEDDSEMYSGNIGEITISISNRGTSSASFLTLSFDSDLEVTPKEYYVGDLDPDDYETVTLNVDLSKVSSGKKEMLLFMDYKDPYNQELSENATVSFTVKRASFKFPTGTVITLAVVGAVAYYKRNYVKGLVKKFKKR